MTTRLSIRQLLFAVNAFVLLVPLLAAIALRIYDTHLVQQTETRLISESVLIGEAFRDRLIEEQHLPPEGVGRTLPEGSTDRFAPVEPLLDLKAGVSPADPPPARTVPPLGPAFAAGARMKLMLDRAQLYNLSSARILDERGCTVAFTGEDALLGTCLTGSPEVQAALAGRYASVVRRRYLDEPAPLGGPRRRGQLRVFTALPVLEGGKVLGVVRMARTSVSPLEALWLHRRVFLVAVLGCIALTFSVSFFLSRTITRPMQAITAAAQAIASGRPRAQLPGGLVPLEAHDLSEALDTMTAQLTDRAQYIAEFAANTSHELKTPLTSIRGAAELLRDDEKMPREQRQRFLGNIEADVARLERLTTRMLHLARIQSVPEAAERVELGPFFARFAERYRDAVKVDCTAGTLTIHLDHFESAVRNLVDNAVRHGGGKPVEVTVRDEAGRVRIEVRDRGPGISEANRARLFTRFFTTERDRGGTGLGLAIVRAVAETRGGSVRCESGPEGTTFTLVV